MAVIEKERPAEAVLSQEPSCVALIAAAGKSTRMNGLDKLFLPLGDKPILAHTLIVYQQCRAIGGIIVSAREDRIADVQHLCEQYGITKLRAVVVGGETRAASVESALIQVGECDRFLAIADGDRPLTTVREIEDTLEEAMRFGAAISAVPVHDTIKRIDPCGKIVETPDRSSLWAAQTPQVFETKIYRNAVAQNNDMVTDDSALVEASGTSVHVVRGSEENIKITTPTDLVLAEAIWKERQA